MCESMKELAEKKTVIEMITGYADIVENIRAGYGTLAIADDKISKLLGDNYSSVLPRNNRSNLEDSTKEVLEQIKKRFWRKIIDLTEVMKLLSQKRADTLNENLERGEVPEITLPNVLNYIDAIRENEGNLAKEAVDEVFKLLAPQQSKYKTNSYWKIGNKVILTHVVQTIFRHYQVSHWRVSDLTAMDRVFHLLDGKGIMGGYRSPLVDLIGTRTADDPIGETEYFAIKVFRNGNLHITFKRPDLVERLNQIAGGELVFKG